MRVAIISDIHANLTAFRACLDTFGKLNAEWIVCLGDIVGYNPWPNECIQIIRERSIPCVMGNHDRVAAGLEEPDYFNAQARQAILWTRDVLSDGNRDFLGKLPERLFIGDSIILVHGSPRDPDEYILTDQIAGDNMAFMEERFGISVGFFGHTHVSGIFEGTPDDARIDDGKTVLKEGKTYLVNPGSIGQPRDGDARSSFLVYETAERTAEFYRIVYDIDVVNEAIVREGLPPYLGKRLFLGR